MKLQNLRFTKLQPTSSHWTPSLSKFLWKGCMLKCTKLWPLKIRCRLRLNACWIHLKVSRSNLPNLNSCLCNKQGSISTSLSLDPQAPSINRTMSQDSVGQTRHHGLETNIIPSPEKVLWDREATGSPHSYADLCGTALFYHSLLQCILIQNNISFP